VKLKIDAEDVIFNDKGSSKHFLLEVQGKCLIRKRSVSARKNKISVMIAGKK
jgi:hypothetical protein